MITYGHTNYSLLLFYYMTGEIHTKSSTVVTIHKKIIYTHSLIQALCCESASVHAYSEYDLYILCYTCIDNIDPLYVCQFNKFQFMRRSEVTSNSSCLQQSLLPLSIDIKVFVFGNYLNRFFGTPTLFSVFRIR